MNRGKGNHLLNQEEMGVPRIRCHRTPYWIEGEVVIVAEAPAGSKVLSVCVRFCGSGNLETTATPVV